MAEVESEIKLRVAGPEMARDALARLGARLVRPRHFEDNVVLDDAARGLAASGRLLRLRRTEGAAVLTFKGPRQVVEGVKHRAEREVPVSDPDGLEAILLGVGFKPVFRYQKYRETFAFGDVEIVVDETPIGAFLEIEGPIEGIHAAATALGYDRAQYISDSYLSLFFASGGVGDMVFAPSGRG
jgi:adenylate cyclase class 2